MEAIELIKELAESGRLYGIATILMLLLFILYKSTKKVVIQRGFEIVILIIFAIYGYALYTKYSYDYLILGFAFVRDILIFRLFLLSTENFRYILIGLLGVLAYNYLNEMNGFPLIDYKPFLYISISLGLSFLYFLKINLFHQSFLFVLKRILKLLFFLFVVFSTYSFTYFKRFTCSDSEYVVRLNEDYHIDGLPNELGIDRHFITTDATQIPQFYSINIHPLFYWRSLWIERKLRQSHLVQGFEQNNLLQKQSLYFDSYSKKSGQTIEYENSVENDKTYNDPYRREQWNLDELKIEKLHKYLDSHYRNIQKTKIGIFDDEFNEVEDFCREVSIAKDNSERERNNHGTKCLSLLACMSNNEQGISSIKSPGRVYYSIVAYELEEMNQLGLVEKMLTADDNGVDIFSVSVGIEEDEESILAPIIEKLINKDNGNIVVAASGNNENDASNIFPANVTGVIVATGVDQRMNLAEKANTIENVDYGICAPGVDIIVSNGYLYKNESGTSFAAPHVAGIAAIFKAINKEITAKELYNLLNTTGKHTNNTKLSGKFIQPLEAIKHYETEKYPYISF